MATAAPEVALEKVCPATAGRYPARFGFAEANKNGQPTPEGTERIQRGSSLYRQLVNVEDVAQAPERAGEGRSPFLEAYVTWAPDLRFSKGRYSLFSVRLPRLRSLLPLAEGERIKLRGGG